ncbi:MAG TPA: PilZ domain-containing protein [Terriglobales bacterium]|nr:PilZ domain-containing protein [Terriglobales bacterium]
MKPERRSTHRKRPEELSYIQFEPEGGGIVVNASEQGLAFHVAAALRQPGPIQVCVSPNPMQQIRLTGEIAWMDEAKKSGGLQFTELTADARIQIRQWLTQTRESEPPGRKFVAASCTPREETHPCSHARNETRGLLPPTPALDNAMPTRAAAATIAVARFCGIPTTEPLPAPFSQGKRISISRPRLLHGVAAGFVIFILAFMPIFSQNFRREIGNSLIRIGQKLKGNRDSQPDASSSISVMISNSSSGNTPSIPIPIPEAPAKETRDQSYPAASTQTTRGTVNATDSRLVDRQNAQQHFADTHSKRGRSALARQLWSEVGAGDSSAEVALAQLYLTGDGVTRNCEQARVLLRAASKNGNIAALQQLRKLNNSACR